MGKTRIESLLLKHYATYIKHCALFSMFCLLIFAFHSQILQSSYFFIALINDFIGSNEVLMKDRPIIRRIKDYCFAGNFFKKIGDLNRKQILFFFQPSLSRSPSMSGSHSGCCSALTASLYSQKLQTLSSPSKYFSNLFMKSHFNFVLVG